MSINPPGCISIKQEKSLFVELGAMQAYPKNKITMSTGIQSSYLEAFKRILFGGSNILGNTFSATADAWMLLEETYPGQITEHTLKPGETIYMKRGAFVACDSNVETSVSMKGLNEYFSNMGFVLLQASIKDNQPGRIFFRSGEGIIKPVSITSSSPIVIDNNNILAYTGNLSLTRTMPGKSYFSWIFGGEGLAIEFTGNGTVFLGSSSSSKESSAKKAEECAKKAEQALEKVQELVKELISKDTVT